MPLILPSNSISAGGYEVDNSLRFDDGSTDYLSRTPASASNRKTYTFSTWIKRSAIGSGVNWLFSAGTSGTGADRRYGFYLYNDFLYQDRYGSSNALSLKFRDISAWYHLVIAVDTTQATESNRIKVYVNNVLYNFASSFFTQNEDTPVNSTLLHTIGTDGSSAGSNCFDGYMAEVVFIDGQALDPTSFGEFDEDTGIWKPIDVSGLTFGTNGFYLDFENSGSLGADVSGNSNNFTVNNLTSIDQTTDTPTNNFCTLNPLTTWTGGGNYTLSQGNNTITIGGTTEKRAVLGTLGFTKGKYYWEVKYISKTNDNYATIGITDANTDELNGYGEYDYVYRGETAYKINNGVFTAWGNTWTVGDIISVAVDCDNNYIYFGKNGVWQESGDPTSGSSGTGSAFNITDASNTDGGQYLPCIGKQDADTPVFSFNFGNPPFTISSGNSDGNGYGNFEYAVPSGYLALNTKNLATDG